MRAAERAAWANLDQALLTAAERQQRIPCADRWPAFTADDIDTLRIAARSCADCPILAVCSGVVPYVFHGAWAGRVITGGKLLPEQQAEAAS